MRTRAALQPVSIMSNMAARGWRSLQHTWAFQPSCASLPSAQRSLRVAALPWATHHIDDIRSRPTQTWHAWSKRAERGALACEVSSCARALGCVARLAVRTRVASGRPFYHTTIARQLDIDITSLPGWPALRDVLCAGGQCVCLNGWWSVTDGCSVRAVASLSRCVLGSMVAPEAVCVV